LLIAFTDQASTSCPARPSSKSNHVRILEIRRITGANSYFDSISRITQPDYLPTFEDICRCSIQTDNIRRTNISRKSTGVRYNYEVYEFYDFRSEPNDWIHAFEDMSIIVYVFGSIPSCVKTIGNKSIRQDLVHLNTICTSKGFSDIPILLLFHDADKLERNFQSGLILEYFPDYLEDLSDLNAVKNHIREMFLGLGKKSNVEIRLEYTNDPMSTKLEKWIIGIVDEVLTRGSLLTFEN
jgi:hypothetical protein